MNGWKKKETKGGEKMTLYLVDKSDLNDDIEELLTELKKCYRKFFPFIVNVHNLEMKSEYAKIKNFKERFDRLNESIQNLIELIDEE